jgi:hypothetical protein
LEEIMSHSRQCPGGHGLLGSNTSSCEFCRVYDYGQRDAGRHVWTFMVVTVVLGAFVAGGLAGTVGRHGGIRWQFSAPAAQTTH